MLAVSEVFSLGYPIFVTVSEDEATNALMTSASDSGRISHPASSCLTARALGYGRGAALSQYLLLPLARTETNHVKERIYVTSATYVESSSLSPDTRTRSPRYP